MAPERDGRELPERTRLPRFYAPEEEKEGAEHDETSSEDVATLARSFFTQIRRMIELAFGACQKNEIFQKGAELDHCLSCLQQTLPTDLSADPDAMMAEELMHEANAYVIEEIIDLAQSLLDAREEEGRYTRSSRETIGDLIARLRNALRQAA